MLTRRCGLLAASLIVTALTPSASAARQAVGTTAAAERPNIVLIFPDNLGWGEVGVYGSVRGVPTPRIDELAAAGIRDAVQPGPQQDVAPHPLALQQSQAAHPCYRFRELRSTSLGPN